LNSLWILLTEGKSSKEIGEVPKLTKRLVIALLVLASSLVLLTSATRQRAMADSEERTGSAGSTSTPATCSNYELTGNPYAGPGFSVGTTCPNTMGTCANTEAEPSIRSGGAPVYSSCLGGSHYDRFYYSNAITVD
jgi:hypothetical protein